MYIIKKEAMLCAFLFLLVTNVCARPKASAPTNSWLNKNNNCDGDEIVQETCQKCAKITKSNHAYPMCCNNEDDVYEWCEKYVNFGVQDFS